jgi:hypothetical protein
MRSTRTSEELREQFLRDVLQPHGSEFTDEIEAQLIEPAPQCAGLMAGFDMSERLVPDLENLPWGMPVGTVGRCLSLRK